MKTVPAVLAFLLASITISANATNYINTNSSQSYSLYSGDTLRIVNNTYNGTLTAFQTGSVVIVSAGATFSPGNMNSPAGKIINYGVCQFNNLGTSGGFEFENFNLALFSAHVNLYDGAKQTWTNNIGGNMTVTGNFSLNNAVLNNYSTLKIGGDLNLYTQNSVVNNTGLLSISKDVNMSNGELANKNTMTMKNFNAWGGQVKNQGEISPTGDMVFNSGISYSNECLLITNKGFTNYGDFTNNGLLWVGRSGSANDHFLNSGTFTNGKQAVVKTLKLTNYSTLKGSGSYYITGESYTSGSVGTAGVTADSIVVYDASRASTSRIFDTQWGTVYNNVVFRPFAQPDTNQVNYSGCSSLFRSNFASVLPVQWLSFKAVLAQNQAVISWSAEFDANVRFEVEKRTEKSNFQSVSTVNSNTSKNYVYNDANVEKNTTIYYRIKAVDVTSGTIKYTDTKSVKISGTSATLALYPNPTKGAAAIQYKSENTETLTVRIRNASGSQVSIKNVTASKGINSFNLLEVAQLVPGVYFAELATNSSVVASVRFIKN